MEEIKEGDDNSVPDVENVPIEEESNAAEQDSTVPVADERKEDTIEDNNSEPAGAEDLSGTDVPSETVSDDLHQAPEAKVDSTGEKESDNPADDEPDGNEPTVSAEVEQPGARVDSPASEKYESAEEELDSGRPDAGPAEETNVVEAEMEVDPSPANPSKEAEGEEGHGSTMQVDENSNSSSHLQDIEMTDIDENRVKNEDTADDDNNRSMDQLNVQDPFDQLKQATNEDEGHKERETEGDDQQKGESSNADKEGETNQEQTNQQPEESNREDTDGGGEVDKAGSADSTAQGEKEGERNETNAEQQDVQTSTATEADAPPVEQEHVPPKESTATTVDPSMEEESSATVDDLTGGENENVCLLPDDERAISEEDKERAIAEEEAEKEAERQETEAREKNEEERRKDEGTPPDGEKGSDPKGSVSGEKEGTTAEEEDRGENDAQTDNMETIEVPDDDTAAEEIEPDGTAGAQADEPPARENQIRELSTPAVPSLLML